VCGKPHTSIDQVVDSKRTLQQRHNGEANVRKPAHLCALIASLRTAFLTFKCAETCFCHRAAQVQSK
jgi:hypothetical protein